MAAALRMAWDAGDAVLPVARDLTAPATAELLASLRPASLTEVDTDGSVTTRTLEGGVPVDDDLALVVATSGSTGGPKGVELPHDAVAASTAAGIARLGCGAGDRWALTLPTHHVAGLQVILRAWALGTAPVPMTEPAASAPDAPAGTEHVGVGGAAPAASAGAEHVALVPTQLRRLLDAGADLGRFATVLVGGARTPPELLERARAAGARVVVSYGMTETCGGCVYDGVPLDGVEVAIRHDGRVLLRGPVLFRRYRHDPAATERARTPDGWLVTGDLGRLVDGHLEVVGRADDVVITGGENVPVETVTARLRTHPTVADVAVVGRPDPEWGEVLVAVVVPRPGGVPQLADLRAHVRDRHPAAYAPRALVLVERLPRDRMGKIALAELRDLTRDP